MIRARKEGRDVRRGERRSNWRKRCKIWDNVLAADEPMAFVLLQLIIWERCMALSESIKAWKRGSEEATMAG